MAASIGLAACNSGGGSSGSASGSSGDAAANAQAVAAAKASVAKLMVRPTTLDVPPLPSKPPTGRTIDFIACGVPACQAYIPLLKQATDAVGWNLKAINSGVTPQTVAAAYDQAVRDKPAGVIGSGGTSPDIFANQLKQLKALGVPVVLQVVEQTSNPVTAIVYGAKETEGDGKEMADAIVADSGGKNAHLAIFSTPQTPIYANAHRPLEAAMKASSCINCSVDTFSFPETDLGTNLPSKVVTYVRTHPNTNYLFFDFTNEVDGVPAALQRAGLLDKVKIVTLDVNSTEAAYLKAGTEFAAAGNPWPEILWTELGVILRANMGLPTEPAASVQLPNMILTKDNLPDADGQSYFPLVANYQDIFKKAWNVS